MQIRNYIIPIFVPHHGCPHDCIFCNQRKITGNTGDVNAAEADKIIQQHLYTIEDRNIGTNENIHVEVAFFGGSFTGIPLEQQQELLNVAYSYKKSGRIQGIRLSTRPDYINDHILTFLKTFDVTVIELGVQSMDDEVLKQSGRGHCAKDVIDAAVLIKQYGFILGLQMMIGLPGDTIDKMYYTGEELMRLRPEIVRIYPTLVIRGTGLEELYKQGLYEPLELEQAVSICKKLLLMFEKNNIHVIRIGLQNTESISQNSDVIAGPFHPAFRELVESEIYLEMIENSLSQFPCISRKIDLIVNPREVSKVIGMNKKNVKYLKNTYNIESLAIRQDSSVNPGSFLLVNQKEE